jgi:uncharacterized protein YdeI (YjbR/CyaY-like superfamily)
MEVLTCASAAEWAAWLEANHRASHGVWLALASKGVTANSVSRREATELALCYGWIDGQVDSASQPESWWAQRFTPRRSRSRWSKINRARAEKLIEAGLMRPAGLEQVERAKADGRWAAAYDPPSTAKVPTDLQEALDACAAAAAGFTALDSRSRYRILLDLGGARRPETRERRIARYIGALAVGNPNDVPEDRDVPSRDRRRAL